MGLPAVDELGARVENAWRAGVYDPSAFSDIAADELLKAHLHDKISPDEIVSWVFQRELPPQADREARFGQPPVTLFRAERFFVSALFWVDGTTTIHDHGFAGAFQVLAGSSIESRFTFEAQRDLGEHLRFGDLAVSHAALLQRGDVRVVPAGPAYIHSLFHLARPTVSLVVRTFGEGEQLNYSAAGTAFNAFVADEGLSRVLQVVDLLRRTEDPSFESRVGELIHGSDPYSAFRIIVACSSLSDRALLSRLVDRVRDPEAVARFHAWVSRAERTTFLQRRRADVHDRDLRFLLAVLLNAHRRGDAMSMVASYAPTREPAKQIAEWLRRLSLLTVRLQVGTTVWEPSLLGLPAFDQRLEEVLAEVLSGGGADLAESERAFVDRLAQIPALAPLFAG